jgi:hypothetical protein
MSVANYHHCIPARGLFYEDYFDIANITQKDIEFIKNLNMDSVNLSKEKHLKWIQLYKNLILIVGCCEHDGETASHAESVAFKFMKKIRDNINSIDDETERMRAKLSFFQHFVIIYLEIYHDLSRMPEIIFKNKHVYSKLDFRMEKNFCEKYCLICDINKE